MVRGALWAWVLWGVTPLAAQPDTVLVFRPNPHIRVQTAFTISGSLRLVDFAGLPDTSIGSYAASVVADRRVDGVREDTWLVETVYDSMRMRYRVSSASPWVNVPPPPTLTDRIRVDERLRPTPSGPLPDRHLEIAWARGLAGVPVIPLPDAGEVARGRWSGVVELPYTMAVPGSVSPTVTVRLSGRGTIVLDSTVVRAADTLAYLRLNAGMNARTVDEAYRDSSGTYPVTVWGAVGAQLVWSTGWDAWVTGQVTLRMHHRIELGPVADRTPVLSADLLSRFSVRP